MPTNVSTMVACSSSSCTNPAHVRLLVLKVRLDETCLRNDDDESTSKSDKNYDEVLLFRLKNSLSGVPPPPLLTHPRHSIDEILCVFKNVAAESSQSSEESASSNPTAISPGTYRRKITDVLLCWKRWQLSNNCDKEECENEAGDSVVPVDNRPKDILQHMADEGKLCLFYDIGYNTGQFSEKIAELLDRYRERYVGCETASFVTVNSPSKYLAKKKERKKVIGQSPARRILGQKSRRKIFSFSSLQAATETNLFGIDKRTILIDKSLNKKQKEARRALFLSPEERKKQSRLELLKRSPSRAKAIEMRRSLWMRRKLSKKNTPSKQTPKKLMATPSKRTPRKGTPRKPTPKKHLTAAKLTPRKRGTPRKRTPRKGTSNFASQEDTTYRNEINENGKRSRSESNDSSAHNRSVVSSTSNESLELSDTQRRKLLWAVSASLKQVGIGSTHTNFRSCGKKLYRICKQIWTSCSSNKDIRTGITERMFSLATEHAQRVVKEVQEEQTDKIELWSQDSNSCDFFSKVNDSEGESSQGPFPFSSYD